MSSKFCRYKISTYICSVIKHKGTMTYLEIENSLKENNFKLEFGFSPLKGMRFNNGKQYAFVFVVKENDSIKHKVEYVDIIAAA